MLTLAALLCTCSAFDKALERIRLDGHDSHDIDFFIEQKLSYIHAKIDLRPTLEGMTTLEKCIYRLEKGNPNKISAVLAKNLNKRLERCNAKLVDLTGKNHRQTRSIEILGNLISDLFGNPGPSDWKKNNANLLIMKSAIQRLNDGSVTMHSDIDQNRHAIELENNELRKLSTLVNSNLVKLTEAEEELASIRIFFEIATLAEAVEVQIDTLVDLKKDSMRGFCNEKAIDKDFLIDNLQSLEANRVGLSPIFGSWEWREYYKNPVCSIAQVGEAVWVTVRIPIVRKSEKLVRYIPTQKVKSVLNKIELYGVHVEFFKEKDNDKYHVIARSALDFCIKLSNTMTCGIRDVKFSITERVVIPIEFAHNRIMLISDEDLDVKFMEKCTNGLKEYSIATDSVVLLPNNCSYVSGSISIGSREADVFITKEIGMAHFEKLEVSKVSISMNQKSNVPLLNRSSNRSSEIMKLHADIENKLKDLDFRHDSFWSTYTVEKWVLIGCIGGILCVFVAVKTICMFRRPSRSSNLRDTACQRSKEMKDGGHEQAIELSNLSESKPTITEQNNKNAIEHVYTEVDAEAGTSLSFSYPKERSQFYSK